MKIKFLTLLIIIPGILQAEILNTDFLFEDNDFIQGCTKEKCIDLNEAIELSQTNSLETKKDALRVYQAQQNIRAKIGGLLPSFNARIALEPMELAIEFIPNLLGFLFPSNWYKMKESILFSRAQETNFRVLLANQINATEILYFAIHKELQVKRLLTKHKKFASEFLNILSIREEEGELPLEILESAKAYLAELNINEITYKRAINDLSYDIGFALNLKEDWRTVGIKPLELPNLDSIEPLNYDDYFSMIKEKSLELVSLEYLRMGAVYAKKARAWTFLDPESDVESGLGVGYFFNLKIDKANIQLVELEKKHFENRLRESLYKLINEHNSNLTIYDETMRGLGSLKIVLDGMLEDFKISGELDIDDLEGIINKILFFQLEKSFTQHTHLITKSNLKRLLWKGEHQNLISRYPEKNDGKKLRLFQRMENRMIKRLIKRGKITLPSTEIYNK
jgi:hypothetical protein